MRVMLKNHDGMFGHPTGDIATGVNAVRSTRTDACFWANKLRELGYSPIIIADEVQHIVQLDTATISKRQQTWARHAVGAMLILAGSAPDLETKLEQPSTIQGYAGYADLNKDLCELLVVPPIMDLATLRSYVACRYGEDINEDVACQLMNHTGGNGRLIHRAKSTDGWNFVG